MGAETQWPVLMTSSKGTGNFCKVTLNFVKLNPKPHLDPDPLCDKKLNPDPQKYNANSQPLC